MSGAAIRLAGAPAIAPAGTAAIGPDTTLCGIVLHPAGHTRSPAMHAAAYRAMGLDAAYFAFDVPPGDLARAIADARALGMSQLAVSIPHKRAVMALLDDVEQTAREIGAVNTVTRHGRRLRGANTDHLGLVRALERATPLTGRRAIVLGAGGTARAAVYGLRRSGAWVAILNRTAEKAEALADELDAQEAGALSRLAEIDHDVLVNTTSVGLRSDASPVPAEALRPDSVVFDAVYDPPDTRLLRDARERGAATVGGKWMLVEQAVEQLRLWTGKEPPREVMAAAFDAAAETHAAT